MAEKSGIGFFPRDQIGWRKLQSAVVLAEIWKNEALQLAAFPQLKEPVHGGILGAVVDTGKGAYEATDEKLTRRIMAQPVTRAATDDRIDG